MVGGKDDGSVADLESCPDVKEGQHMDCAIMLLSLALDE